MDNAFIYYLDHVWWVKFVTLSSFVYEQKYDVDKFCLVWEAVKAVILNFHMHN